MRFLLPGAMLLLLVLSLSTPVRAATFTFTKNLQLHSTGSQVTELQEFLTALGDYSGPITGNFLTLTYKGVVTFQQNEDITPASGYFGPLTRAKANAILASTTLMIPSSASSTASNTSTLQAELASLQAELQALLTPTTVQTLATSTTTTPITTTTSTTTTTSNPKSHTNKSNQTTTNSTSTTLPPVSTSGIQWGAYAGDNTSDPTNLENLVGKQMNLVAIFVGWGNTDGPFPSQYQSTVAGEGKTLVIFWEPSDNSGSLTEPNYNYDSITSGSWDSYFTQFASDAKAYGGPVILVPFAEMNGNWDPWDGTVNGNSSASFTAAWQHMHTFFANDPNVKFAWDVNSDSEPNTTANSVASYYPGGSYVDYVGEDVFNFNNPWTSFSGIANTTLTQLKTYGKPIYIFSMGSAEGTQKAAWITDALATQIPNDGISGWVWFNVSKEQDWTINSDASALAAFIAALPH